MVYRKGPKEHPEGVTGSEKRIVSIGIFLYIKLQAEGI